MVRDLFSGIGMTSARTRERLVKRLREQGIRDESILQRFNDVPRHIFVDEALASRAYEDNALPIGHGQTISQPYIVALMTQALLAGKRRIGKVLEVGSGCGYQTAIMAPFVQHVFGVERIAALIPRAQQALRALGIQNVSIRHGDGFTGWSSQGPFEGIIAAAAPADVPIQLLEQLQEGGRLVIPVGGSAGQTLRCITRVDGEFHTERLAAVSFVPMLEGIEN